MKYLNKVALTLVLILVFATTGNIKANNAVISSDLTDYQTVQLIDTQNSLLVDCSLVFKNDDGTSFEVTFHDVTLYQCAKMKVGKWIKETF